MKIFANKFKINEYYIPAIKFVNNIIENYIDNTKVNLFVK